MIAWAFFVKKENPITEEDIQALINYANQNIYITPLPVDGQQLKSPPFGKLKSGFNMIRLMRSSNH